MITYIIKFILCSALLLLVYRVFLGNERLYRFNRFYLLFSLLFSLAVPFVTISMPAVQIPYLDRFVTAQAPSIVVAPVEQTAPVIINESIEQQNTTAAITSRPVQQPIVQASATDYLPYSLLGIYGTAVLILLLRFAKNSWHISHLVTKNTIIDYQDTKLVLIDEEVTPHSFLNYVFINKDAYQSGAVEPEIICHEQAHVRQLHSLDVIFVELLQVVFWFNPFIPFYRKAIQLNHEFLADEAVIESYQDTPAYQYLLLAKASQCGSLYLTSQFNYLITKKRLIMMTKNTSTKIALSKKLAMVPLLAIAVFLFSQKAISKDALVTNMKDALVTNIEKRKINIEYLLVTPKKWAKFMGNALRSKETTQVFISKLNTEYGAHYRLLTTTEFKEVAKTYNKIKMDENTFILVNDNPASTNNEKPLKVADKRTVPQKLDRLTFPIIYPSTKGGASPELLKEYAEIAAKYSNDRDYDKKPIKVPTLSNADRNKLEDIFKQMSLDQQKQQKLAFTFNRRPYPVNVPSQAQIDLWKKDRTYRISLDNKIVSNSELENYKAADFSYFYKAHIEWQVHRKHKYQHYEIQLMTTSNFNEKNKDRRERSSILYKYKTPDGEEQQYTFVK